MQLEVGGHAGKIELPPELDLVEVIPVGRVGQVAAEAHARVRNQQLPTTSSLSMLAISDPTDTAEAPTSAARSTMCSR